ncbi:MAG: hypothetical protein M1826_003143 [Phylliscum demangeonii]|nr:MAG: hypothetical protein M1826_003143 [Phylliscum demangeonii]
MFTVTSTPDLPPLPPYTMKERPALVAPIPDKVLILLLPIAAYWLFSLFFHYIDVNDYWPQYRLHTPEEILKRNRVSRRDVVRDVVFQQVIQTIVGYLLGMTEPEDTCGDESFQVAVWAQRVRWAQRAIPRLLSLAGIDGGALAQRMAAYSQLSGALAGGRYPTLWKSVILGAGETVRVPTFARWEFVAANLLYWAIVPALQFLLAILVIDTWQYFWHRGMHMNQWLYRSFHSRHHRLYVPYAFGALYNHPVEGFLLDTLGAGVAYKLAGLSTRQGMLLFTGSTIKTVDDHCGYALPWDPLQLATPNNAAYHDIHHQTWGIKTNFSQPFFTFWDRLLGTAWSGGDVSTRYARARLAAGSVLGGAVVPSSLSSPTASLPAAADGRKAIHQALDSMEQVLDDDDESGGARVLVEELAEEKEADRALKQQQQEQQQEEQEQQEQQKPRRTRTLSAVGQAGSWKNLTERVHAVLHGRSGAIIGLESSR